MSFAIGSSEPELWFLIQSSSSNGGSRPLTMDRRTARRSGPHRKGATVHGAERKPQRAAAASRVGHRGPATPPAPPPGYFTAELVMAFLLVAASLALLPLVLPPLSPPPFLLLLVPVGLLAVLAALAFVPLDAQSHLVGSSR
ncbi:hypothetical protein C2845_PM07G30980 [Panicum miliaceum]|uniref:Uncharacterized protein n=1 Tax=Panicum miliaceum TaxID=4540 RepID=A0A3L6SLM5_PANMI|nr:hypothetical protein C2845_PM07G30980 [Panicum miliaceum]